MQSLIDSIGSRLFAVITLESTLGFDVLDLVDRVSYLAMFILSLLVGMLHHQTPVGQCRRGIWAAVTPDIPVFLNDLQGNHLPAPPSPI